MADRDFRTTWYH